MPAGHHTTRAVFAHVRLVALVILLHDRYPCDVSCCCSGPGAATGSALSASFGSVGSASLTSGGGAGLVTGFVGGTARRRFTAAAALSSATVIEYTYDALHRLTRADYSDGRYFVYTYDAVGNRLTEVACSATPACTPATTTYTYDDANRLETVNSAPYTWDDNGNLLVDGTFTYTYDAANRLIAATDGVTASSFVYNGLGDRVGQTVAGVVTTYTLDLAAGLTQVLADGTNTYLYGNGRIAQDDGADFAYFLADALGSVRQLADESGDVTLAKSYEPYGGALSSAGTGVTNYGFTGEQFDSSTSLLYLRARFYSGAQGRFTSRDTWPSDNSRPHTLNGWAYVEGNPINATDPSGHIACRDVPASSIRQLIIDLRLCDEDSAFTFASDVTTLQVSVDYDGVWTAINDCIYYFRGPSPKTEPKLRTSTQTKVDTKQSWRPGPVYPNTEDWGPKQISLGIDRLNGQTALVNFTFQLRNKLGTKEIYYYEQWFGAGITTVPVVQGQGFNQSFTEATSAATAIHFNLDGIGNPVQYANSGGSSGRFPPGAGETYTAIELYLIRHDPGLCSKTRFWRGGATWFQLREVPSEKASICGT